MHVETISIQDFQEKFGVLSSPTPLRYSGQSIWCAFELKPIPNMRRTRIPVTILAIALSACVVEPELLNSERIKQRFGSFGLDVLHSSNGLRRASLHSIEDGRKLCRTYAIVRFDNVPDNVIGEEHARILAGSSIGATFKANGWTIYKETRYIGELQIPAHAAEVRNLMAVDDDELLAMHVYRLLLKKDEQTIDYATIIELHHPEYLTEAQVTKLYMVDEPARLSVAELGEVSELVSQPQ